MQESQESEKEKDPLAILQKSINKRQHELQEVTKFLATEANKKAGYGSIARVILIFLGAFVATREVGSQLLGVSNPVIVITYALIGLIIAVIAGLETAFKWDSRAADLKSLAASCHSTLRQIDTQWHEKIGIGSLSSPTSDEQRIEAAQVLLELQDTKLSVAQEKAAALGVNISFQIQELQRIEGRPLYPA